MKEYFVEVQGEKGKHCLKAVAQFVPGEPFISRPRNEREFLTPGDPDEVDIQEVYLCHKDKERLLSRPSEYLIREIEERIIEEENGERYVI